MRKLLALAAALIVSACSTGVDRLPGVNSPSTAGGTVTSPRPAPAPSLPPGAFRNAPVQNASGIKGVIGARASALTQRFGPARIDLTEGDARKLQFLGSTCVLDIFLYPGKPGAQPVATHVEARARKDGTNTDRARCIREVERQR